jgi:hypothetical protein
VSIWSLMLRSLLASHNTKALQAMQMIQNKKKATE